MAVIPAAGTRARGAAGEGRLEVALVHRPRYDDWAWAKGKLDPGEDWAVAAVRETAGGDRLDVRLGPPAAGARLHRARPRPAARRPRRSATGPPRSPAAAGRSPTRSTRSPGSTSPRPHDRLDYARDRDQLRALVRAARTAGSTPGRWCWSGTPRPSPAAPWPAPTTSCARSTAPGADARPGDRAAARRVRRAPAWSPRPRCAAPTPSSPYAASARRAAAHQRGLSEEGYEADPAKARRHLRRLLDRGEPAVAVQPRPGAARPARRPAQASADDAADAAEVAEQLDEAADDADAPRARCWWRHVVGSGAARPAWSRSSATSPDRGPPSAPAARPACR